METSSAAARAALVTWPRRGVRADEHAPLLQPLARPAALPEAPGDRLWSALASPASRGAALALAGGVAGGLSTPLMARASATSGPLAATGLLQAGGALFCGATAWAVPQAGKPMTAARGRDLVTLVGTALTGAVLCPGALTSAMKHTSAVSVALTMNIEPFLAAALAWPLFGERPGLHSLAGAATAVGSAVLCTVGELRQAPASGLGIGTAVGAASLAACADLGFYGLRDYRSQQLVATLAVLGALCAGALAGLREEVLPDAAHAGMLLGTGALAFGATNTLYALALPSAGVGRATLIYGTTALSSGTALSCAMGQGTFTPFIGASLGLALLGAVILSLDTSHAPPHSTGIPPGEVV
jgi:hypothetical protein